MRGVVVAQLVLNSVTEILPADAGRDSSVRLHGERAAGPGDLHRMVDTAQQDTLGVTLADDGWNRKYSPSVRHFDFIILILNRLLISGLGST